ncbi:hypothetical protein Fleli_1884 [Bernardetia litoralis DSM 6794]|uniref:Uncharacterized protein n=1 Tax=Bernardetia litoralis (strain ATCC 23117 / DSM 6794 / NBRC 15988 / NCIMB 1366 / Fx l1 / Sio-4) TaxID=880071 RepID=I4AJZ2_BERLS|nr:hypothetical protein [Bernardetia litoralis]AFM04277.1 hypothetical protein Fleli_1884 [Bernardetia litoralis DSM 6794]
MENVQGTYKLIKKASVHTFLIGLAGVLMGIIPYFFLVRTELWEAAIYLSILLIPLSVMGIVLIIHSFYYEVVIAENTILLKLPSTRRSFSFDEIRGFRTNIAYVHIYSEKKKISISNYTKDINKIHSWLQQNFTNLDELPQEESNFIKKFNSFFDRHFSNTDSESDNVIPLALYNKKLSRAKYIIFIYDIICIICVVWLFLYPYIHNFSFFSNTFFSSYKNAFVSTVVLTIVGVIIPKVSNGFIRYSNKDDDKPYIRRMFFLLGTMLTLRVMLDVNLLDYSTIFVYSGIIGLFLTTVVMISKEFNFKKLKTYFQGILFLFSFTVFGYGAVGLGNFLYDNSIPKTYKAKIIKREMYSGKVILFSLKVEKWHETSDMNKIQISRSKYQELEGKDSVTIYLKEGLFGIPWLTPN